MEGIARHEATTMLNRRSGNEDIGIRARMTSLTGKDPEVGGPVENGVRQRQNERVAAEREKPRELCRCCHLLVAADDLETSDSRNSILTMGTEVLPGMLADNRAA